MTYKLYIYIYIFTEGISNFPSKKNGGIPQLQQILSDISGATLPGGIPQLQLILSDISRATLPGGIPSYN